MVYIAPVCPKCGKDMVEYQGKNMIVRKCSHCNYKEEYGYEITTNADTYKTVEELNE